MNQNETAEPSHPLKGSGDALMRWLDSQGLDGVDSVAVLGLVVAKLLCSSSNKNRAARDFCKVLKHVVREGIHEDT